MLSCSMKEYQYFRTHLRFKENCFFRCLHYHNRIETSQNADNEPCFVLAYAHFKSKSDSTERTEPLSNASGKIVDFNSEWIQCPLRQCHHFPVPDY